MPRMTEITTRDVSAAASSSSRRSFTEVFADNAIIAAVQANDAQSLQELLKKGATNTSEFAFDVQLARVLAKKKGDARECEELLRECDGSKEATFAAVVRGHYGALCSGVDDHIHARNRGDRGRTLLHVAALHGRLDMVRLLLARHADVHAIDDLGWTALQYAAQCGLVDVVRELLAGGGARNEQTSDGRTLLHLAAGIPSRTLVVEYLLETSNDLAEDLKKTDHVGLSPLHHAARARNIPAIGILLSHGAAVNATDKSGQTALYHSCAEGNVDVVRVLLHHGAKPELASLTGRTPLRVATSDEVRALLQFNEPSEPALSAAELSKVNLPQMLSLLPVITAAFHRLRTLDYSSSVNETVVGIALMAELRDQTNRPTHSQPQETMTTPVRPKKAKNKKKKKRTDEKQVVVDSEPDIEPDVEKEPDSAVPTSRRDGVDGATTTAAVDSNSTVILLDQGDSFPFHVAVQKSHGEIESLCELLEVLVMEDNADPMAAMPMLLRSVNTSRESLCAAEYAYALGYSDVGDYFMSRMQRDEPESEKRLAAVIDKTPALCLQPLELVDGVLSYIWIIDTSKGDVNMCKMLCRSKDPAEHSVLDGIQAEVVRECSQPVSWSAVEYASYLGYVDVVDYLLKQVCQGVPSETKIQLQRASQKQHVLRR